MRKIIVVDYGSGNLRSVSKALEAVAQSGDEVKVSSDPKEVGSADRIVLPGQGAMGDCMRHLKASGLEEAVRSALATKPVFAVCIGMQMLFRESEEDHAQGLGILPGRVIRFPASAMRLSTGERLKVPEMGWNRVYQAAAHPLWAGIEDGAWFYLVHSYFVSPEDIRLITGMTVYGLPYASAVAKDNVFATQFHPEKSAGNGLRLYSNFLQWNP
ncbi:imidazole glycerol phosphate synthase subunit HisH [Mesosutterella sp. OilRF-GAM-744-9]|uniref:Imidazole glycerol phosphate synthase subunit HisH n=1 Tax=Mesosutterella porci TaxID=2915351 RepID=A0ABS9MRY0_9BURK|nr:imidazole glycerol phosphate synthase subunit HisH [Mesosutterella sp. oilRF-744-WT-GAM-9]MCG5031084.1 imidazole glycerol phosphate synthase subunit HisH [Mesosutterella sp. oilRF-744-WT-GAM-9]MCI6531295.1 imidazole glycerol phosphate synthase subunit HisH [Mesosutterella sp.]